jgi:hypothetical protein
MQPISAARRGQVFVCSIRLLNSGGMFLGGGQFIPNFYRINIPVRRSKTEPPVPIKGFYETKKPRKFSAAS